MIEIAYLKEKEKLKNLPQEVKLTVLDIVKVLDSEYGEDRDKYLDCGGYVIVVEKAEDIEKIKKEISIDCDEDIPEYVNKILCSNGSIYTNSLIICNNDYAIVLIIPIELTPNNLKEYID